MSKFIHGKKREIYTFKGVEIIEYNPNKKINDKEIEYDYENFTAFYVPWLHESFPNFDIAVIAILCRERLGINNHLAYPIARMLCMLEGK